MKFLKRNIDETNDVIKGFLKERGVENVELFLNPTSIEVPEGIESPFNFYNMATAVKIVLAHLSVKNKIGILVDSDADGLTSSAESYGYLKKVFPDADIIYILHDEKRHGLSGEDNNIMDKIMSSGIDLLIIPDAGSNDIEEIQKLQFADIDVVVLDHHEIENYTEGLTIVNTKHEKNPNTNKNLTGAGMVYKFNQCMDIALNIHHADDFLDLMAIGQIGDSSDISDLYIRNKVFKGLENINNPLIKFILGEELEQLTNVTPNDISFKVCPVLNAVCRIGNMDERGLLFSSLSGIGLDEMEIVTKKKKNKDTGKFDKYEIELSKVERCFDMLKKVKTKQNNLVKKVLKQLENKEMNHSGIANVFVLPNSEASGVTGLIAMKLVQKYQTPALVIHNLNGTYIGSGRGFEDKIESFKNWCTDTKLFNFAQGHNNAFGVSINEDNLQALQDLITKTEDDEEIIYKVDFLQEQFVDKDMIDLFNENRKIIGGNVDEAVFGFKNIKVNKKYIRVRGSVLTFFVGGITFISYNTPQEKIEQFTLGFNQEFLMNFVGSPSISSFGKDSGSSQIVLQDFEQSDEIPQEREEIVYTEENIMF